MGKIRFFSVFLFVLCSIFLSSTLCFAVDVSHEYGPLDWSFMGKPVPDTIWSPWLPLAQVGIRFKLGFLISDGTISIKSPIKLTFRYDPDTVRSGQDVTFAVIAQPAAASYNTFQSAFGISFPNKIQLGFVGLTGVPIDLPWFDLPMDFWDLVSKIPKVGENISSAVSNIGVNTSTQDALPLGATESYHNERDLISVEISKYKVEDLAPKVLGKIPESVRDNAKRLIKLATLCSDSEALAKLEDYTEKALSVLYDAPTLTLRGDPYFKLEGVRLRANIRVFIPGGKGSGLYTLYFDKPNQQQIVTFRDITPFISSGDKLTIKVEDLAYEFRLVQGLTAKVQVSVVPIDLDNVEKTVTYTTAVKNVASDPFKIEIPILPSNAVVQSLRANRGCTSVSVNWASPSVPVKGTVKAFDGNTQVATVIENTFKTAHNVIVPNLQSGKTYRFTVDCVNQAGQIFPGGEVTATTAAGLCPERKESTVSNTLTLSNPNVVAGPGYIDFYWNTNQLASTEVMFSPSPDLSLNYVVAVKKVGDVVTQGWVTREGPRQFETNHSLRLAGLEGNTTYYYNLRSWTFTNNDETNNPQNAVGYTGSITTLPTPPPPSVKIRVRSPQEGNVSVPEMPVVLTKNTDLDFRLSVSTGTTGVSNDVILDKGTTYYFKTSGNSCYDFASKELVVSNTAQGSLGEVVIDVNKLAPRKGFILSGPNQGIAGATVSGKNSSGATVSATTTASGAWVFTSGFTPGSYTFTVTKDGFKTTTANATVNSCGRFNGLPPVTMVPRNYTLNITVKDPTNKALKNASVLVKEGNATIAQLTTDLKGQATKSGTFNDDNEHIFTIEVTPAATTTGNILPASDFVAITSASVRNVNITTPADRKAPVASQVKISQVGKTKIKVDFKLDDEKGKSSLEYQDPEGKIKTSTWKTGMSSPGSGVSDHVTTLSSGLKAGNYRIKVKAKDKWNNEGEGEIKEFQLFGESLWDFKIASQTSSGVTFSWNKYPYAENFGKYKITIGTKPPVLITDINTTSYTLTDYTSSSAKQVKLTALPSQGTGDLALPATISLPAMTLTASSQQTTQATTSTSSQQTSATQTTSSTQQTSQATTGSSSQATQSQQGDPTQENTIIKFSSKPYKAYANKELSFKLNVQTSKSKAVEAVCSVDWGDGKKDSGDAGSTFKHVYPEAGTYKIIAEASLTDGGAFIAPEPVSVEAKVLVKPPTASLSKSSSKDNWLEYNFKVKAEEGSYPIAKWTLSFGDGKSESAAGEISKVITHTYAGEGNYNVEFSVTDTKGTLTKKNLSFKIVPKAPAKN